MVCYKPLQVYFRMDANGKKQVYSSKALARSYERGANMEDRKRIYGENITLLPCGKCTGCRLERSRQWATRCSHEASLYSDNCFVTLTYDNDHLPHDKSVNKKHLQDFFKRLRKRFQGTTAVVSVDEFTGEEEITFPIRYYACGEYGKKLARPHYHAIIFNYDFPDKVLWKVQRETRLYTSKILSKLWPFGFSAIGDVTFESAAYVARYCMKKVNGNPAIDHYQGRQPEFNTMSLKPGIGKGWYDWFKRDVYPSDEVIVRGRKGKPPRYYDKLLEREDPSLFLSLKDSRLTKAQDNPDSTFARLKVREKVKQAQIAQLVRTFEDEEAI